MELGLSPVSAADSVDPALNGQGSGRGQSIQFRSHDTRSAFIVSWLGKPSAANLEYVAAQAAKDGWGGVNYVLAEECMRQAMACVRHESSAVRESANQSRRFCQAVYHGLMSIGIDLSQAPPGSFLGGGQFAVHMPLQPGKRYRYLYLFVYRQCVENEEWRLSRALGRSDVRLDLLNLFIAPHLGPLMLMRSRQGDEPLPLLPPLWEVEKDLPLDDPVLRCDLLEALGRAGLDTPGGRGATEWALSVLPGWRAVDAEPFGREKHSINCKLPPRGQAYARIADSALKLRVDWFQSSGEASALSRARSLCVGQLDRMGISPKIVEGLGRRTYRTIARHWGHREDLTQALGRDLMKVVDELSDRCGCARDRYFLADILFRLAEIEATSADLYAIADKPSGELAKCEGAEECENEQESTRRLNRMVLRFSSACAIYWVADRIRSNIGAEPEFGLKWPSAGARPFRYYIRSCLKLSRLVLEAAHSDEWSEDIGAPIPAAGIKVEVSSKVKVAMALLQHAHNRLGLYSLHQFRFQRERVSLLLLEAARLRSWALVNAELARERFTASWFDIRQKLLDAADCLTQARSTLLAVTGQRALRAGPTPIGGFSRPSAAGAGGRSKTYHQSKLATWLDEERRAQARVDAAQADLETLCLALAQCAVAFHDDMVRQLGIMGEAFERIEEVEGLQIELGYQRGLALRSMLEKTKLGSNLARILSLEVQAWTAPRHVPPAALGARGEVLAKMDDAAAALKKGLQHVMEDFDVDWHRKRAEAALQTLKDAAEGNPFWSELCKRQEQGLVKTRAKTSDLVRIVVHPMPDFTARNVCG